MSKPRVSIEEEQALLNQEVGMTTYLPKITVYHTDTLNSPLCTAAKRARISKTARIFPYAQFSARAQNGGGGGKIRNTVPFILVFTFL